MVFHGVSNKNVAVFISKIHPLEFARENALKWAQTGVFWQI